MGKNGDRPGKGCSRHRAVALLLVVSATVRCNFFLIGGANECSGSETACEGNTLLLCEPPRCAEPGCPGHQWHRIACINGACIVPARHEAQCTESPVEDPRCNDEPYCADNHAVTCVGNYAIGTSQDCGSNGCDGPRCFNPGNPECNGASGPVCVGNRHFDCVSGFIARSKTCACEAGASCCSEGVCLEDVPAHADGGAPSDGASDASAVDPDSG